MKRFIAHKEINITKGIGVQTKILQIFKATIFMVVCSTDKINRKPNTIIIENMKRTSAKWHLLGNWIGQNG